MNLKHEGFRTSSSLRHFSSPHLTLTAQPLCTVCPEASCILHGYNGGRKKERRDLRLSLRTLISQSSWLHKSFLMYDTGDNRGLHLLFTVQHQESSGVGSPPALLLLTCVVLTRRAGSRAMIKHWRRNEGRRVQVSRPDARIQRHNATRFQEPLWNQLRLLCPAALGSPLLVPFSGWLGWGAPPESNWCCGNKPNLLSESSFYT